MFEFLICFFYGIIFLCVVRAVWNNRKPCNLTDQEAEELFREFEGDASGKVN